MEVHWNEIALEIAREVEREVMPPLFGTPKAGETIGTNVSGDVTEYVDKVAEDVVLGRLQPLGVNVVSEERGFVDNGSDYTVIVDPIDGSYNFTAGIPVFALSFAVFRDKKPVYGAIYEFVPGNFYEAIPGEGAFMNGKPIKVRKPERGKEALSFYTRGRCTGGLIEKVKRVRVLGAIAVELAYLAKGGALDGVLDVRNYVRTTDIAAGALIAREAGALITDERGRELKLRLDATSKTNIVAVNDRYLLDLILEELENELERYFHRYGKATFTLFLINVAVYTVESILSLNPFAISGWVLKLLGQWNYAVLHYGWWWQPFTAMFVHVGILHIGFNMYFLLVMGRQLEGIIGPKRLVLVYLVSGLAGNLLTLLMSPMVVSAGASGALFGIAGALILITGVVGGNIQGALMNAFVLFLINSLLPGVNALAHLGGLLVGMAMGYYYGKRIRRHLMARMYGYGW